MATFTELGLNPAILQSLADLGFTEPTPIQEKCIPYVLSTNQDLVALAQTGTGKTAAFALPVIHSIDRKNKDIQALILCPTRELCLQITKDIQSFTTHMDDVGVVAVYGGDPVYKQLQALRKKPQIVVGTPGRVADFVRKNKVNFSNVNFTVLDEADEMLNMGFKEELDQILEATPETKRTFLFSATMSRSIERIAKNYMHNPKEIAVASRNEGSKNVTHTFYNSHPRDRYQILRRLVDMNSDMYGIVFCRTRNDCKELVVKLTADNYLAEAIHGELDQNQREKVMKRFRDKKVKLLIATDVAARGIDVKELSHVINYSLPDQLENYVHRSGRTGRAGNTGESIALIGNREIRSVRLLERKMSTKFERGVIPTGEEVCKKQLLDIVEKVKTVEVDEDQISNYLEDVYGELAHLDRETVIKHFLSLEFNRFLDFYKEQNDLNQAAPREMKERYVADENTKTLKLNLGKQHGFEVKDLFGLLNRTPKLKGAKVGRIKLQDSFSLFEIDAGLVSDVITNFNKAHYNKHKVLVREGEPIQNFGRSNGRDSRGRSGGKRRFSGRRRSDNRSGGTRRGRSR